jgi:hypothetical protein
LPSKQRVHSPSSEPTPHTIQQYIITGNNIVGADLPALDTHLEAAGLGVLRGRYTIVDTLGQYKKQYKQGQLQVSKSITVLIELNKDSIGCSAMARNL